MVYVLRLVASSIVLAPVSFFADEETCTAPHAPVQGLLFARG
jgi:hypothetical protein